ncbi:MAG: DUF3574 domain-containing protein [Verrucomicrobia bacterium]|nr:DUF3574 domain-containing protein [Verrucomicrobiota bacterium]
MKSHLHTSLTLLVTGAALLLYSSSSGCATAGASASQNAAHANPTARWLRTELYMAAVDSEGWRDFLAINVTPGFPDGFTVVDAYGQ